MAVRHAEDVIGLRHQLGRQHAAALARDVNAQFFNRLNRIRARRLPIQSA